MKHSYRSLYNKKEISAPSARGDLLLWLHFFLPKATAAVIMATLKKKINLKKIDRSKLKQYFGKAFI
jgi:hypothetical protein